MLLLDGSYTVFESDTTFLEGESITLEPPVQGSDFTASIFKVSSIHPSLARRSHPGIALTVLHGVLIGVQVLFQPLDENADLQVGDVNVVNVSTIVDR